MTIKKSILPKKKPDMPASFQEQESDWHENVSNSKWLVHIGLLISVAREIAFIIHKEKKNVLIHCSDGWDRTPQLSAIAQLLLDPYFRTLKGFLNLICKEFLSFGHMFSNRCGHTSKSQASNRSPIFIQFLDCVYQLKCQFPNSFEFNDRLLEKAAKECFSCKYGTFLYNSEKERIENSVETKTVSFWTIILQNATKFKTPFFIPTKEVLYPSSHERNVRVWPFYYRSRYDELRNRSFEDISPTIFRFATSINKKETEFLSEKLKRESKRLNKANHSMINLKSLCCKRDTKVTEFISKIRNNLKPEDESMACQLDQFIMDFKTTEEEFNVLPEEESNKHKKLIERRPEGLSDSQNSESSEESSEGQILDLIPEDRTALVAAMLRDIESSPHILNHVKMSNKRDLLSYMKLLYEITSQKSKMKRMKDRIRGTLRKSSDEPPEIPELPELLEKERNDIEPPFPPNLPKMEKMKEKMKEDMRKLLEEHPEFQKSLETNGNVIEPSLPPNISKMGIMIEKIDQHINESMEKSPELAKTNSLLLDGIINEIKPPTSHPPNMTQDEWDNIRRIRTLSFNGSSEKLKTFD